MNKSSLKDALELQDYLAEFEAFHPVKYLIDDSESTEHDHVYLNRLPEQINDGSWTILIIGPSGSGKDFLGGKLVRDGWLNIATTATTRPRRVNLPDQHDESIDDYVWMDATNLDVTNQEHRQQLIDQYELIESDVHHGNLYGLPKQSLDKALEKGHALIRTESEGAKVINQKLKDKYNLLTVFVVPDSYDQLWNRISGRGQEIDRMLKSLEYVKEAKSLTNFFIHNTETVDRDKIHEMMTRLIRQWTKQ